MRRKHAYAMGIPYRAVLGVPLDLFPDTPHCELVVLFERQTDVADTAVDEDDDDEDVGSASE